MALVVVPTCAPADVQDTVNRTSFLGSDGPSELAGIAAWLLDSLPPQDKVPAGHVPVSVGFRDGRTDDAVLLAVPLLDFTREAERSIAAVTRREPDICAETDGLNVGASAARQAHEFALIAAGRPVQTPRGAHVYAAPEAARNLGGIVAWATARLGLLPAIRGIVANGDAPAVVAAIHAERPNFQIEVHVAALPVARAGRA